MKFKHLVLLFSLLIFAFRASAIEKFSCPQTAADTKQSVNQWAEKIVNAWEKTWHPYDGLANQAELYKDFQNFKKQCKVELPNMEDFLHHRETTAKRDHDFGFLISSEEYFKDWPQTDFQLPDELKRGIPENYVEISGKKGWKYFEYSSSSVRGEDDSYRRLLFLIEENDTAKWIQFTLPKTASEPRGPGKMVDIITVHKPVKNQKAKIAFAEYVLKGDEYQVSNAKCLRCHANGPRLIRPAIGSVVKSNVNYIDLNAKIVNFAKEYDYQRLLNEKMLGPPQGEKQKCTACHSAQAFVNNYGNLHGGYDRGQIFHKMMERLHMPPEMMNQWKYRHVKAALSKVNSLPLEKRGKFISGDPLDYPQALKELLRLGILSAAEYELATKELNEVRAESFKNFEALIEDYKGTLFKWLISGERSPASTTKAKKNPEAVKPLDIKQQMQNLFDF